MRKLISFKKSIKDIHSNEIGATMLEYAMLSALISVVAIVSIQAIGQAADDTFFQVNRAMTGGFEGENPDPNAP